MMTYLRGTVRSLPLLLVAMVALAVPASVLAHAEFESSDPAADTTVEAPFAGPITLTFSEALETGSGAELRDSAGAVQATSEVDGAGINLTPDSALVEGAYEIRWTAVADDGHIERGTVPFTVVEPATPEPTPTPTPTPEPSATGTPSAAPSAAATDAPTAVPSPAASPTPDPEDASSGTDVLLPIVLGGALVAGLAFFLLRRRDSGTTTPS